MFSCCSVLKTFVYDPLVEWGVKRHRDSAATSAAREEVSLFAVSFFRNLRFPFSKAFPSGCSVTTGETEVPRKTCGVFESDGSTLLTCY